MAATTQPETRITPQVLAQAEKVIAATPSLESQVREMGEENLTLKDNGEYTVRAPDHKAAYLLKEMYQDRHRAEAKLSDSLAQSVPMPEARRPAGRAIFTGGWLPNAKDREAAG